MNTIFASLIILAMSQSCEYPSAVYTMKCYPETVQFGDSIYITVDAMNPHEKSILIPSFFLPRNNSRMGFGINVVRPDENAFPLLFEAPVHAYFCCIN